MSTAAGKNKKKKGQAMSLGEFHAITPATNQQAGGTNDTNSSNSTRINWADEMEKIADSAPTDFFFDRSQLPTAPKAALGPDIDLELVPKKPPFTAHISNVSFEADEEKIKAFFKDLKVDKVNLIQDERGRLKGYGFVEFSDRDSLIAALSKVDTVYNGRAIKITLDEQKSSGGNTGGYGNRQHQSDGHLKSDEAEWRRREPEPETSSSMQPNSYKSNYQNQSYNNRYNQNNSRDNQRGGYNNNNYNNRQNRGGGQGQGQGTWGGNDRNRQSMGGRQYSGNNYNQNKPYNDYSNRDQRPNRLSDTTKENLSEFDHAANAHNEEANAQSTTSPQTLSSSETLKERPKLHLAPRSIPANAELPATGSQPSIFGGAKPVNTAAKEREIEERLKREKEEREAAEKLEKEKQKAEAENENSETPADDLDNQNKPQHAPSRSHKTSVTSDDSRHHQQHRQDQEFQTVGSKRHNKNDTNNNNRHSNQNRVSQNNSFTSPPSANNYNQPRNYGDGQQRPKNVVEAPRPAENAWKKGNAGDLFNKEQQNELNSSESGSRSNNYNSNYNRQSTDDRRSGGYNNNKRMDNKPQGNVPRSGDGGNRRFTDRNNDRGGGDRNKQMGTGRRQPDGNNRNYNRNPGDRQTGYQAKSFNPDAMNHTGGGRGGPYGDDSSSATHNANDLGFNNKFSNLKLDVGDVDDEVDEN